MLNDRSESPAQGAASSTLQTLRGEIDRVDDAILELIEQRLAASSAVAASKDAEGDGRLKLRPRREAEVIGRLAARSDAPRDLIAQVWRTLMSHGLQAQARTEIVVCAGRDRLSLYEMVRGRFGPAAPVRWVKDPAEAIEAARSGEAVAVISDHFAIDAGDDGLIVFDTIEEKDGKPVARCVGRVAPEDAIESHVSPRAIPRRAPWQPASWRQRPAAQMPVYPDAASLGRVEGRLAASDPLVDVHDIMLLRAQLAQVAAGRGFMLQGGDCAESFAEFGADKVRTTFNLLLRMGAMLQSGADIPIVHLARIAGQFAKPRSAATETVGEIILPSYRGDAVNGPDFTRASRTPDPKRLLEAHRQAEVTIELLDAFAAASYADLRRIHNEAGIQADVRPISMFTSHEALLLNYEQALARFDQATESWWATSGHLIWIGDRTRSLDGAHVEFARGVANPVGLKCGPSLDIDSLLRLIDVLDPQNQPGRLVLIGRFGAGAIADTLPEMMRATRREGRHAIWSIDPMHGNTRSVGAIKTRVISDIVTEITTFFEVARAEQVHPGGVHLEMTGEAVTECLGGSAALVEADLPRNYLTHCDPRLNAAQALDVAAAVRALLEGN
ncbi:MAG: 3-deoxy-D-arabinoheptulosonate-7-phosphate synthase [Alphaproteobacteria bacterium]|nr:3-deoxy-D-arabinoheptulosonate-7-phosphate synthase [Alphaproteobacteria bacterium]